MPFFTNHTRSNAVLTIKVNGANNIKASVKIGIGSAQEKIELIVGYHDLMVPAGASLELVEGTDAIFVAIRAGD